ncbi:MAG TPA: isoprenylcysteine carboxylmethyltransferase family protein [Anaerolineae bacterium]|nr:isoprenylcysteine carboxylmethyltransferase family protein [Anaerolineae bacterium]
MKTEVEMERFLLVGLGFVVWAVGHSVLASQRVKGWVQEWWGTERYEGYYRFVYNVVAVISFVPVWWGFQGGWGSEPVWSLSGVWRWLAYGGQVGAVVGLYVTITATDAWHFMGVRQMWAHWQGEAVEDGALVVKGMYRWVRHPLYTFSLLFLWLAPTMTVGGVAFNVLVTIYFWVGSIFEERKLVAAFGEAYERYQAEVPRLVPGLKW